MQTRRLTTSAMFVAIGVVLSWVNIPIGVMRAFPIQHLINVLSAVYLGPLYGVLIAFATSSIRIAMGTGTLLAYPGSMCGALLAGLLYKYRSKLGFAFFGEVFGTGIIGGLLAYPIAKTFLGAEATIVAYVIPFLLSTFVGAAIAIILVMLLMRVGYNERIRNSLNGQDYGGRNNEDSTNHSGL